MSGWSHQKRVTFETAFYQFLSKCFINSKDESGPVSLGDSIFLGQRRFITAVMDGLEEDIHKFYVLKSRQLGLSTISRALSTFYIGVHKGLKGALVFDTAPHREEARADLIAMIKDLPGSLKFPTVKKDNREGLLLANDSKILFMSAGVKETSSSGTLGRSVGLTFHHSSELCSWNNLKGLRAFEESLSDVHPDRLYIYESTATGFNKWYDMWTQASLDTAHCKTIFIGWWGKDTQRIDESEADFQRYGIDPPTEEEAKKIKIVRERYDVQITPSMLAWVRRKYDPLAVTGEGADGGVPGDDEEDTDLIQEQPWTEDEAFQQSGSTFFPAKQLTDQTVKFVSDKYKRYMYLAGSEFVDMKVYPAPSARMTDLKLWEEPDNDGSYIIACDPAYGENEHNDRSSIQVLRCYSDGIDQVAEYASPLINTRQLAWVIASLLGYYGVGRAEARYILELNGPGTAVFNELKQLRFQIENAYFPTATEKGLQDIFRNVKTYIFQRPDGMTAGQNYHMKTNVNLKVTFMERLRDFVSNGTIRVRSMAAVKEMMTIKRDGDSISAPQALRDDCVLALAFGAHYWETHVRRGLITQKRTREAEAARKRLSIVDQVQLFQQNTLASFFEEKRKQRVAVSMQSARAGWRGARR